MSLVKLKTILDHATENRYGVLAINTFNFETIKWAITAAEQENVPVIIQFYPGYDTFVPQDCIAYMAKSLAQKASVPVAVHLDHSPSYEIAVGGIRNGYPSIMVDGSALPYKENVALTAAVVRTAHVFDIDVEAELGHVGFGSSATSMTNSDLFTDPTQAREFVELTNCDALAIAVGNAHGPYVQTPNLDFERIKAIRNSVNIPLVLHGSSDIPDGQIRKAVNLGISKFNLATEYFRAYYNTLKCDIGHDKTDDAHVLITELGGQIVDFLRGKMQLVNPKRVSM